MDEKPFARNRVFGAGQTEIRFKQGGVCENLKKTSREHSLNYSFSCTYLCGILSSGLKYIYLCKG